MGEPGNCREGSGLLLLLGRRTGEMMAVNGGRVISHIQQSYCASPASHSPAPSTPSVGAPHVSLSSLLLWVSPPDNYELWLTALLSDYQRTFPGCRSEGKARGLNLEEKRQKEVNNKKRTADHADSAVCKRLFFSNIFSIVCSEMLDFQ